MATILTKSEFAAQIGVSRSRISQWISAKQIYGDALVGAGRSSRIRVAIAVEQLKKNLDISQRLGANGRARLDVPNESPAAADADATVEAQIKAQRLEQLELANDRARSEAAARNGYYTIADYAKQQMGRIASQMLSAVEGWLGQLASKLAAHFAISQHDVLHLLRAEFRLFRASASADLRREAEQLPVLVADPIVAGDEATPPPAGDAFREMFGADVAALYDFKRPS